MTSRSDSLPLAHARSSGFPWQRFAFSFILTISALLVFTTAFAVGYARIHEGRVLPGVHVAGVSLAGLDRTEAEAALRASLPALSAGSLTVRLGGLEESIPYAAFGRDYDVDHMLGQALELGRGGSVLELLHEQMSLLLNGAVIDPVVTWDSEELVSRVAAVALAAEVQPVDATINREGGRYVASPAVVGQTVDLEQAAALAMAAVNNIAPDSTTVVVEGTPVLPAVDSATAQAAADRAEAVVSSDLQVSGADLFTVIDASTLRGWVHLDEVGVGQWELTIETDPIVQFAANYGYETDIAPVNATYAFARGGGIDVVPSEIGRAVDVETTAAGILAALQGRAEGQPAPSAGLALVDVQPEFSTSDAQGLVSRIDVLSTWTTRFTPSPLNGDGINIQIPTSIIDGYVVQPGEEFDFLDVIGPITSPPYLPGAAIINNRTREDGALGGGMCSCSTTVFNAALRAGLDMGARRNHSYYINRYPVGLDATVWIVSASRRQTMEFVNDMQYPVLIRGINEPGAVTFELWGVPDGRTVELSEPVVENFKESHETLQYTNDLPAGRRDRIEYSVDGFESTVTRTVRDAGGAILHEDTFRSRYKMIIGITLVGRYPGDPSAGTTIPASDYTRRSPPDTSD